MNIETKDPYFKFTSENLVLMGLLFENGYFISISEKNKFRLGTTAISLPLDQTSDQGFDRPFDRRDITTASVIGSRNELYTKALAEKITIATQKLVYLSLNFQENNEELYMEAMKLIDDFVNEIVKN
jgi:hypothetical protein